MFVPPCRTRWHLSKRGRFALKSSLPTALVDSLNNKQHSLSEYNKAYIPLLRLLKTIEVFEQILIGFCQHYQSSLMCDVCVHFLAYPSLSRALIQTKPKLCMGDLSKLPSSFIHASLLCEIPKKYENKPLQIQDPQTRNAKTPPLNRPSGYKPCALQCLSFDEMIVQNFGWAHCIWRSSCWTWWPSSTFVSLLMSYIGLFGPLLSSALFCLLFSLNNERMHN